GAVPAPSTGRSGGGRVRVVRGRPPAAMIMDQVCRAAAGCSRRGDQVRVLIARSGPDLGWDAMTVTYLMLARLPADGAAAFDAYESAALPLLAEHGGHLERRLRTLDDRLEAHLVSFAS